MSNNLNVRNVGRPAIHTVKRKVGRQIKILSEKEVQEKSNYKRYRNKIRQRKKRANDKIKLFITAKKELIKENWKVQKELNNFKLKAKSQKEINNLRYRLGITNHYSQYKYEYYLVGTFDPDYLRASRNICSTTVKDIPESKKISHNSLKVYTERYLQHLLDENIIINFLVTYEQDKKLGWHSNIVVEPNPDIKNIPTVLHSMWLIGYGKVIEIESHEHKRNVIFYMTKEINIYANSIDGIRKIEGWDCTGMNYTITTKTKKMKRLIYTKVRKLTKKERSKPVPISTIIYKRLHMVS